MEACNTAVAVLNAVLSTNFHCEGDGVLKHSTSSDRKSRYEECRPDAIALTNAIESVAGDLTASVNCGTLNDHDVILPYCSDNIDKLNTYMEAIAGTSTDVAQMNHTLLK